MFYIHKKNNGVTLIALVITIIILLILAGISITTLFGENGILKRATSSKEAQQIGEETDWITVALGDLNIRYIVDKTSITTTVFKEAMGLVIGDIPITVADGNEEYEFLITYLEDRKNRTYLANIKTGTVKLVDTPEEPEEVGINILDVIQVGQYVAYDVGLGTNTNNGEFIMNITETGHTGNQTYNVQNYNQKWRVLYVEEDRIEIISTDNILTNDTSSLLYLNGKQTYNNFVFLLNTMSSYYINSDYAISARSVGSDRNNSNLNGTNEIYTSSDSYIIQYANDLIISDSNYIDDVEAMDAINAKRLSKGYWLASRNLGNYSTYTGTGFFGRAMGDSSSPTLKSWALWHIQSNGTITNLSSSGYGVRPVIRLKTDLKVNNEISDGTETHPWVLIK